MLNLRLEFRLGNISALFSTNRSPTTEKKETFKAGPQKAQKALTERGNESTEGTESTDGKSIQSPVTGKKKASPVGRGWCD
jgi:hypothetical protein